MAVNFLDKLRTAYPVGTLVHVVYNTPAFRYANCPICGSAGVIHEVGEDNFNSCQFCFSAGKIRIPDSQQYLATTLCSVRSVEVINQTSTQENYIIFLDDLESTEDSNIENIYVTYLPEGNTYFARMPKSNVLYISTNAVEAREAFFRFRINAESRSEDYIDWEKNLEEIVL